MEPIVEILKSQTASLKVQYLEMTEIWASENFDRMMSSDFLYRHESGKYFQKRYGKTRAEDAMIRKTVNTINKGKSAYVSEMRSSADDHYENSILKLAHRITKKELIQEQLEVKTSHIGVNIETTLTDGIKTVRAFTIIASGSVQRPHYRYLIK
jgi:hypothetical protein